MDIFNTARGRIAACWEKITARGFSGFISSIWPGEDYPDCQGDLGKAQGQRFSAKGLAFLAGSLLVLFWKPLDASWQALWIEKWAMLYLVIGIIGIWTLITQERLIQIALSYGLICLCISSFSPAFHGQIDKTMILLLREASQSQLIAFFALLIFLHKRLHIYASLKLWGYLALLGILLSPHPTLEVRLLFNPSMAATFVILTLGLNLGSVVALALTHSWTASLALAALWYWRFRKSIPIPALLITLLTASAWVYTHGIPDNGRFTFWRHFWVFWKDQSLWTHLFGLGASTLRVWIPYVNILNATNNIANATVWLHNDWLQILFEFGWVGLAFALACAARVFCLLNEKDQGISLALFVSMLSNMPNHWALHALIGWSLMAKAILLRDQVIQENNNLTSCQSGTLNV